MRGPDGGALTAPDGRGTTVPGARGTTPARATGAFPSAAARRRYWILLALVCALAAAMSVGLLVWDNPMPPGTRGFRLIALRRASSLTAMLVVATCQAMSTVAFQTVAANRVVTPSILGFESLYRAIHTSTVFFLGAAGLTAARTLTTFVGQLVLMVALCLVLYTWLLTSQRASVHTMLLLGVVIGAGLGSVSTFMQRLLTPSEFDVLTARLFGSVTNADPSYYPLAVPLVAACAAGLALMSRRLDVLALGRDTTTSLGLGHRGTAVTVLVLVAVLMATSTALTGPMTFLGFLVATMSYQLSGTPSHRHLFAMAVALGVLVLTGAYFVMYHLFSAQGVVSVLIEMVGGTAFILTILRKGRL